MSKNRALLIIPLFTLISFLALQLIEPSKSWLPLESWVPLVSWLQTASVKNDASCENDASWNSPTSRLLLLTPSAAVSEELFNYGKQLAESHPEISHATLPDDFIKEKSAMHTTLSTLDFQKNFDTYIVVPAIPGTSESFAKIASRKTDSRMIAICPMEAENKFRKGRIRLLGTQSPLHKPEDVIQECIDSLEQIDFTRRDGKLIMTFDDRP